MYDRMEGISERRFHPWRQRLWSLVRGPRVILADEPTGALDVETGGEVMTLLDTIASESGAALIAITHDLAVAARAQRHYRLAGGVLVPIVLNAPGQVTEWVGDLPVSAPAQELA